MDHIQTHTLRKMFFRLVTSQRRPAHCVSYELRNRPRSPKSLCGVRQRKNSEPPWGIESQTFGFALRCSTTKPQKLFGERGLLRSSYDTQYAGRIWLVTRRKNILLNSSPSSKLTIPTISIKTHTCLKNFNCANMKGFSLNTLRKWLLKIKS